MKKCNFIICLLLNLWRVWQVYPMEHEYTIDMLYFYIFLTSVFVSQRYELLLQISLSLYGTMCTIATLSSPALKRITDNNDTNCRCDSGFMSAVINIARGLGPLIVKYSNMAYTGQTSVSVLLR